MQIYCLELCSENSVHSHDQSAGSGFMILTFHQAEQRLSGWCGPVVVVVKCYFDIGPYRCFCFCVCGCGGSGA